MGYDSSMHINAKPKFIPSSPEGEVCFFQHCSTRCRFQHLKIVMLLTFAITAARILPPNRRVSKPWQQNTCDSWALASAATKTESQYGQHCQYWGHVFPRHQTTSGVLPYFTRKYQEILAWPGRISLHLPPPWPHRHWRRRVQQPPASFCTTNSCVMSPQRMASSSTRAALTIQSCVARVRISKALTCEGLSL